MYYAASLTLLGGTGDTPLRSLLSKLVDPTEYGKIFTLASVASSIASLLTSSGFQEIYAATVSTFPGTIYVVSAGIVFSALVIYKKKKKTLSRKITLFFLDIYVVSVFFHLET
jgi:hypothetical protein